MEKRSGDIAKIAAVCVLLAAAFGVYRWNFSGEKVQPDSVQYVCARTGKLFRLPRDGKARELPLVNPETKERTLIPVVRLETGDYAITNHRIQTVRRMGELNKVIDLDTLRVKVATS
jgi:hypothetical protein